MADGAHAARLNIFILCRTWPYTRYRTGRAEPQWSNLICVWQNL